MFTIVGAATTRLRLYDFISGSDATPADAAFEARLPSHLARGTRRPPWRERARPGGSGVARAYDTTWNINPTITATSEVLQVAHNQRATFRWVAIPDGELIVPATAGAGLALMSIVASATANYAWSSSWQE
jgi:hypothetical protein